MTLRVDVALRAFSQICTLEIIGSDARLTDQEAADIQQRRITADGLAGYLSTHPRAGTEVFGLPRVAFMQFAEGVEESWGRGGLAQHVESLLTSEEALVPRFNSPPSAWLPLKTVAEQASAIGLGITWGGASGPTMVGAYVGGLFLVKFITPIVSEAGNATAAGVSAKIRAAFGIEDSRNAQAFDASEEGTDSPNQAASPDEPESEADSRE
ncbi:hypothetical protein [Streptomyces olivochromogenes]|uniref:hypothetical protein n=1 Tax=Streptomyces olivochromogenes TaxID=1963 RepID=UPI00367EF305